jgi:Fis family transcriptional regulator
MDTTQESQHNEFVTIKSRRTGDLPLSNQVKIADEHYFSQLDGYDSSNLYDLVTTDREKPLLAATLENRGHNQTHAAKVLGLSRSTLRKKMEQYGRS